MTIAATLDQSITLYKPLNAYLKLPNSNSASTCTTPGLHVPRLLQALHLMPGFPTHSKEAGYTSHCTMVPRSMLVSQMQRMRWLLCPSMRAPDGMSRPFTEPVLPPDRLSRLPAEMLQNQTNFDQRPSNR